MPIEKRVIYVIVEFGEFHEAEDLEYIRYRINLDYGTAEVDMVSNEDLLVE